MRIRVACSPDADDLFMMRALMEGHLDTGPYELSVEAHPTDALNRLASSDQAPEVCAISFGHYPAVADRFQLLPHGGSMGEGYGPVVVAREPLAPEDLRGLRVAVPGTTTTAYAVLRMIAPDIEPVVVPIVPYARIFEALRDGDVDAGLIIHEGRLTYEDLGFRKVVELGTWWAERVGELPLPLGANALRRDLPEADRLAISELLRASIAHALEHQDEVVDWLLARGGALATAERVHTYLGMYANQRTLDYGPAGREGIRRFFEEAVRAGVYAEVPDLVMVGDTA